jgi:three-Cys-motif partner protein
MVDTSFFDESREQSRTKSRIVAKYFGAWAKVIISTMRGAENRIAYIDLFAGPGRYSDGTPSTPVIVLEMAIKDTDLRDRLVTVFNDKTPEFAELLKETINTIPGIGTLKHKPRVENEEVGRKVVEDFRRTKLIPTLLFVDPWGYKGLSVALITSALQSWGCDCIFFFNYNRINPGLSNEVVRDHMNDLFGEDRADAIREKLTGLRPDEREDLIIEELSKAIQESGVTYVLPFTFKSEKGTRTKHHLVFASKNFKGYEIMKEIMAKESSEQDQGVASFAYSSVAKKYQSQFEFLRPLSDLEDMLLTQFAGQRLTMYEVYERHSVGRPFIKTNYKKVLTNMEATSKITANPPAKDRRKIKGEVTFGDDVVVIFPKGNSR